MAVDKESIAYVDIYTEVDLWIYIQSSTFYLSRNKYKSKWSSILSPEWQKDCLLFCFNMETYYRANVTRGTSPEGSRKIQDTGKSYMHHNTSKLWTHKSAFTAQVLGSQACTITLGFIKKIFNFSHLVLHFYVKHRKISIKATFNVYIRNQP